MGMRVQMRGLEPSLSLSAILRLAEVFGIRVGGEAHYFVLAPWECCCQLVVRVFHIRQPKGSDFSALRHLRAPRKDIRVLFAIT